VPKNELHECWWCGNCRCKLGHIGDLYYVKCGACAQTGPTAKSKSEAWLVWEAGPNMKLTRWQILEGRPLSRKNLFRCLICERTSPTPDKQCPTMDCEGIEKRLNDISSLENVETGVFPD
jgi:hypothetical protein